MNYSELKQAIDLSRKINDLLIKAHRSLPYNLNVIDELHANENAHSRILCKLLQYQDENGKYSILESFITQISKIVPSFSQIVIEDPLITQEKGRIDLWIRDKKYAIILENKVCGASDQNRQLERYIDKTKKYNRNAYRDDNIYIVYLPADNHDPSNNSWGKYYGSTICNSNYANISYQYTILPWLQNDILPFCTLRENILSSAIYQYIDYLNGAFGLRTAQKQKYHMEKKWLKELGLEGDFPSHLEKLTTQLTELQAAHNVLSQYRDECINRFVNDFISISLDILNDTYGGEWGEKGNIFDGWLYFYNNEWCTGSLVHIEWSEVKINDLFAGENIEYEIKLHVEGILNTKELYTEILKHHLGKLYKRKGKTTFWFDVFSTDKPLGVMNKEELNKCLRRIYTTGVLKDIIYCIAKVSSEYKEKLK